ncbi:hypothetical protein ACHWQZ_G016944 [Mnemiopsis leidyi]
MHHPTRRKHLQGKLEALHSNCSSHQIVHSLVPFSNSDQTSTAIITQNAAEHRSQAMLSESSDSESSGNTTVQIGEYQFTEAGIVEMNKQQFNDIIQGLPEIQSILLRDMRRRGLTRKAVQKCRQRQNMRLNELDQKKKELQEKLRDAVRKQEEMTLEYERARLRYEHAQSRIVEHLRKHPGVHTHK